MEKVERYCIIISQLRKQTNKALTTSQTEYEWYEHLKIIVASLN